MSRAKTPPVTLTDTEVEEACAHMFGHLKCSKNVNFIAINLPRFVEFKAVPYGDEPAAQKQSERIAAQSHNRAKADSMEKEQV